jgi:hypothetical protein
VLIWGCAYPPERVYLPPEPLETKEHLAKANYYFGIGDFKTSLQESRLTLNAYPQLLGDKALFQIGLIYGHPENPEHDLTKAREAFGALISRYPDSPLRYQAELWILTLRNLQDTEKILVSKKRELIRLRGQVKERQDKITNLQEQNRNVIDAKDEYYQRAIEAKNRQIKELEEHIDKLKEVDIKIEEKKRKTSP